MKKVSTKSKVFTRVFKNGGYWCYVWNVFGQSVGAFALEEPLHSSNGGSSCFLACSHLRNWEQVNSMNDFWGN